MLNQTDLNNACAVTKQYKIGSFFELLTIRQKIWKIQIFVTTFLAIIGFPTTLLITMRYTYLHKTGYEADSPLIA